jgi:hypothetical protein
MLLGSIASGFVWNLRLGLRKSYRKPLISFFCLFVYTAGRAFLAIWIERLSIFICPRIRAMIVHNIDSMLSFVIWVRISGFRLQFGKEVEWHVVQAATYYRLWAGQWAAHGQWCFRVCLAYTKTGIEKDVVEARDNHGLSTTEGDAQGQSCFGQGL